MNNLHQIIKESDKEFDKKFPYDTLVSAHQDWTYGALKSHIHSLLISLTQADIQRLKGKMKGNIPVGNVFRQQLDPSSSKEERAGYKSALLSEIKEKEELLKELEK